MVSIMVSLPVLSPRIAGRRSEGLGVDGPPGEHLPLPHPQGGEGQEERSTMRDSSGSRHMAVAVLASRPSSQ